MYKRYSTSPSRWGLESAILHGLAAQEADELLPVDYPLPSLRRSYESACQLLHLDVPTLTDDDLAWEQFRARERRRAARDRTKRAWCEEREARLAAERDARLRPVATSPTSHPHPEPCMAEARQPQPASQPVLPPRPIGARRGR